MPLRVLATPCRKRSPRWPSPRGVCPGFPCVRMPLLTHNLTKWPQTRIPSPSPEERTGDRSGVARADAQKRTVAPKMRSIDSVSTPARKFWSLLHRPCSVPNQRSSPNRPQFGVTS
jgi:hypothetical protein